MTPETVFSPDRLYRYTLWRVWGADLPFVQFIGLNPSTADETKDDPTIRRCIGFAKAWGYGALCMTNLFAWRATDPGDMMVAREPIGEENDMWLKGVAAEAQTIVAAWGKNGSFLGRGVRVKGMISEIKPLHCLRTIGSGAPEHPLYLPKDLKPILL
jgi:hypothetical protein